MSELNKEVSEEKFTKRPKRVAKKKVCVFCADKSKVIDYKDVNTLKRYVTEKGKIVSRRQTGTCAMHQRALTTAIKRARNMAILTFRGE
ncbi:MAG: 30S ribosomal protein S18 [Clostridia bacterium]|nr:30S ribosomal protein S18 [Clostridia bacterium]MBQ9792509.1 30S ribosomal protein S18 [Clostridia bacterium]